MNTSQIHEHHEKAAQHHEHAAKQLSITSLGTTRRPHTTPRSRTDMLFTPMSITNTHPKNTPSNIPNEALVCFAQSSRPDPSGDYQNEPACQNLTCGINFWHMEST